jgi:YD repeat-containing protein
VKKQFLISSFLFMLCFSKANAQLMTQNPTVPAASIDKQSLEISNDLFNGKANISLPVYNYQFEGLSFPISLSYSAGNGIRPDELPSWVGSGWNLEGSGFIHRTVRGKPDEALDFESIIYDYWDGVPPTYKPFKKIKTVLKGDYSYIGNLSKLNVTNWYTSVNAAASSPANTNISWTDNQPYLDLIHINSYPIYDLSPDEYTFSFGNVSGKFYLNHLNKWIVASNDGKKYEIEFSAGEQTVVDFNSPFNGFRFLYKVPKLIKKFTMTSEDGIKYTFGSSDVNTPFKEQLFEYSHASVDIPDDMTRYFPIPGYDDGNTQPVYTEVVPHTWHLSKVENLKTGSIITFNYKREGFLVSKTNQAWGNGGTQTTGGHMVYNNSHSLYSNPEDPQSFYRLSPMSKTITPNWTLTSINFPNQCEITFTSSKSTQLSTDFNVDFNESSGFQTYADLGYNYDLGHENFTLMQLDKMSITRYGNAIKDFVFSYSLSPSQRLQLSSIKEKKANEVTNEHSIYYKNNVVLPPYGSRKKDHWGFYNNNDFFSNVSAPYNYANLSSYTTSRDPNANYSAAEIIDKIVYPTGGEVEFEFEPHEYSKKKEPTTFSITNLGSNIQGGGVRIKKIKYFSSTNKLEYEKLFEYNALGTSTSSGVLSQPPLNYLFGNSLLFYFQAEGFMPVFSQGNHITYTTVTEKQIGNGKIENTFSNYDNGYNDLVALQNNITGTAFLSYGYTNQSYKRGNLLNSKTVDANGNLIKEVQNKYLDIEDESNKDELRNLHLDTYSSSSNPKYTSVSNRIYTNLPIETTTKNFTSAANLVSTNSKVYDTYGNVKEIKKTDSKGNVFRTRYKYAYEYSAGSDNISLGINNLIQKKCKNYLIEEFETKEEANGSNIMVLSGTIYTYKTQSPFVDKVYKLQVASPFPFSSFVQSTVQAGVFSSDVHYPQQAEISYDKYAPNGNILQVTSKSGVVESMVWGYNQEYLIAKITGVDYNTAFSFITNPGILENPPNDQQLRDELNKIRMGFSFSNLIHVTTFTHSPLIGMTSQTDPNGKTTYYDYDYFGRLALIRDQDKNVLKKVCYNYAGQPIDCTSPCIIRTPDWQNTATPPRCQQTSPCVYTGYQEQEQKDMNPCSPTYNQLQWVMAGYNPLSCPAGTNVQMTYQNFYYPGFTATYTNALTGAVFTFPVPATGSGFLGCLPAGTYYVNIAKPGNTTVFLFGLGCRSISGTSGGTKITISATACNQVSISLVNGE